MAASLQTLASSQMRGKWWSSTLDLMQSYFLFPLFLLPLASRIYLKKSELGSNTIFLAFGLMLVFEGLLPLIAPQAWRETFKRMIALKDGQLRLDRKSTRLNSSHG